MCVVSTLGGFVFELMETKKTGVLQSMGLQRVPGGSDSKESTCNVGDLGSIPGLGRFPGGGHGNILQLFLPGEFHGLYSQCILYSLYSQSMGLQRFGHD